MFKRDILVALEQWAASDSRKPLVLRGARQVGKTYIVNEFGKQFDNYLYVNLERQQNKALFDRIDDTNELLIQLFANNLQHPIKEGRTLLFIDEIQNSAAAIRGLRYFYEDRPDLYVIAAGSLLETLVNVQVSFPVGRVQYMAMHPVSFREFLSADGKDMIRQLIADKPERSIAFHETLLNAFHNYALIGGMPEVVNSFVEKHDIMALNSIYDTLLRGYKDDVEKYAPNRTLTEVIRFLIDKGWNFAAQKITLGNFAGSSYKAREIGEAFRILERAMLLELVYPNAGTELPILPQLSHAPKLIWLDAGLTNYAAHIQKEVLEAEDILDAWRGAIAEQLVAQELLTLSNSVTEQRYCWSKQKSEAEVDFEYLYDGKVFPIEVKSGHNAHLRSLHQFMDACPHDIAIRVWSQPLQKDIVKTPKGKQFTLYNIPFYLVGMIPSVLKNY